MIGQVWVAVVLWCGGAVVWWCCGDDGTSRISRCSEKAPTVDSAH